MPIIVIAALMLPQPAPPPPTTRTVAAGQPAEWSAQEHPRGETVLSGGVLLEYRPRIDAEDPEVIRPSLRVTISGFPPVQIIGYPTPPWAGQTANVGRWDAAGKPFVLFQSYSGGAHCCTSRTLIYPDGGQLKVMEAGGGDGEAIATPRDEDGDGRIDFVEYDNAFLYAFTFYAASIAPPTIYNVIDNRFVEVSDRPGFRPLFERLMRATRAACIGTEESRNGACAAYVAAAARLGRFEEAWIEMLSHYNTQSDWDLTGCRVAPGPNGCPPGQSFAQSFPQALHRLMRERGYIALSAPPGGANAPAPPTGSPKP